jgi:phage-related baseplate assembly protein
MSAIDLSTLSAPTIVEVKTFDNILSDMLADLATRAPTLVISVADPAYKILEVAAYREMLIRQEAQDGGKQVMLAYATGANLDQIGANYNCARLTGETDANYRTRIALSLEAISTAGPTNSYRYHALSVEGVADCSVASHTEDSSIDPGTVVVTVLATPTEDVPNGTPTDELIESVYAALNSEDVRPLTDTVVVQATTVIEYAISAKLYFYPGPDSETVMSAAQLDVEAYVESCRRVGYDIARSGLFAALHQSGVARVTIASPSADVTIDYDEIAYCTGIILTNGGIAV